MDAILTSDQRRAVSDVVTAVGEDVIIAGRPVLAIVGTRSAYLYADSGYTEAEALSLTVAHGEMPTGARAGESATVRGIEYTIAEIEATDGAVATLTLR